MYLGTHTSLLQLVHCVYKEVASLVQIYNHTSLTIGASWSRVRRCVTITSVRIPLLHALAGVLARIGRALSARPCERQERKISS